MGPKAQKNALCRPQAVNALNFLPQLKQAETAAALQEQLAFNVKMHHGQAEDAVLGADVRALAAVDVDQRNLGVFLHH